MLRQLISLGTGKNESLLFPLNPVHGTSLLDPISKRSCTEAEIDLKYCSCPSGHLHLESEAVEDIMKAVMEDLNDYLKPVWGCHKLQVTNITEATIKAENNIVVIEANVRVSARDAEFNIRFSYNKLGSSNLEIKVSRLDMYDLTSHCIQDSEARAVRSYCICII